MKFLQHLKDKFDAMLIKFGIISEKVKGYLDIAIHFTQKVEDITKSPTVTVAIKDFVPEQYQDEVAKVEAILPQAIGYLTQSEEILNAGTPTKMLQAFIEDLKKDVPGVQKSKLFSLGSQIVALLDGKSLLASIYSYLFQKFFTAKKVGVEI